MGKPTRAFCLLCRTHCPIEDGVCTWCRDNVRFVDMERESLRDLPGQVVAGAVAIPAVEGASRLAEATKLLEGAPEPRGSPAQNWAAFIRWNKRRRAFLDGERRGG